MQFAENHAYIIPKQEQIGNSSDRNDHSYVWSKFRFVLFKWVF